LKLFNYKYRRENDDEFKLLNNKIDIELETFDKENITKRSLILSQLRSKALFEYKASMDELTKDPIDTELLYSHHEKVTVKCMQEIERLCIYDTDIVEDRLAVLNELKTLYSKYLASNSINSSVSILPCKSRLDMLKEIIGPLALSPYMAKSPLTNFNLNIKNKNNYNSGVGSTVDLFRSTVYVIGLFFYLISSYFMLFNELFNSLNIQYASIFNYVYVGFKLVWLYSFRVGIDFLSSLQSNIKVFKRP
jgi:hypothetical protein